ncbi:adhesion G-protein coupled receptor D1-like [Ptychodera flava]|uniref:adhesion G-protein coupled receptor D1-like n=1 Tax=Ptychodera flava TaxID=63121 RepID=UPI00396A821F
MQPLLGLTWIFGVFSVNAQTAFFQFLFVTLNSIQGVVMFIFHCLLNDEVKKALQLKKQKLASSAEYSTSMTTNLSTSKSKKTLTSVAPSGNSEQEISDTQQMNGDKERPKTGGKTAWQ